MYIYIYICIYIYIDMIQIQTIIIQGSQRLRSNIISSRCRRSRRVVELEPMSETHITIFRWDYKPTNITGEPHPVAIAHVPPIPIFALFAASPIDSSDQM